MPMIIAVFGVLVFLFGLAEFVTSKNVMGQIVSGEFIIAGAVFFSCGMISLIIQKLHTTVALSATAANNARDGK